MPRGDFLSPETSSSSSLREFKWNNLPPTPFPRPSPPDLYPRPPPRSVLAPGRRRRSWPERPLFLEERPPTGAKVALG